MFGLGDPIRATQKCLLTTHSCPSCGLLPPRGIGKPFVENEKGGGSGGDRTHIQSLGALRSKLTVCHSWASGFRGRVPSWSIHTPEFRVRICCHDSSRFVRTLLRLRHVSVLVGISHERADFYGRFMGGSSRKNCYCRQSRRTVRCMRILQSPCLQGFRLSCLLRPADSSNSPATAIRGGDH